MIHSSKVKSRTNFFEFARELPPGSGKKTGGPNLEIQGPVFFKSGVLALGWEGGGLQRRRGHLAVGGESLGPGQDPKARLGISFSPSAAVRARNSARHVARGAHRFAMSFALDL